MTEGVFQHIILEKEERVAKITLNRPKALNAINTQMLLELKEAIKKVQEDDDARILVVTGAGDRAFSAGADVGEMKDATPLEARKLSQLGKEVFKTLSSLEKPTIAAVNGYALGGGCELAIACDIRIASENARFGQVEINVGIIPGWGGSQILPRLVGLVKAKELILTGDMIDAGEAERIGLVNKVVPMDKLDETMKEFTKKLLSKSSLTLKLAKDVINRGMATDLESGLMYETEVFSLCFATEDQKEGMKALLEKRKPEFKGK